MSASYVVCVHVDDIFVMGSNHDMTMTTKKLILTKYFDIKDTSVANVILGIKILKTSKGIVLTQSHYVETIHRKFNLYDIAPVKIPVDLS